jgi:hypothetical protein
MRGNRHPVFERVQQLLPAEARPGAGGEQDRGYMLLLFRHVGLIIAG